MNELSKTEWFAGQALAGLLAESQPIEGTTWSDLVHEAFELGELMSQESNKRAYGSSSKQQR